MNVTLPEKTKYSKRDKIIYGVSISIALISLIAVIYIEITHGIGLIDIIDSTVVEEKKQGSKNNEEVQILKSEFDNKFNNTIEKNSVSANIKKIDTTKDIIYTKFEKIESKAGSYDVNVSIPYININSKIINKYNTNISKAFEERLNEILNTEGKNEIYSVQYVSSINGNILSLMIKSNLKEGENAQRTIIQTYNYDIENDKELTLNDVINSIGLSREKVQNEIKKRIEEEQKKVQDLRNLGYNIYSRNYDSGEYSIENSKEYYCTSNTLYIVYAYGNKTYTSETDVVVL